MYSRRTRVTLAWLIAGLLLFAQAIGIVQACAASEATPAMAFSEDMAGHGCDESAAASTPNPNACLQHCTTGDQTTAQVPAVIADMPAIAVLNVPMAADRGYSYSSVARCDLHSPDPPPSIRFCSFQL